MHNEELFDQKVERFLKKQMSPEEERLFKEELASDNEKLARAKTMALAIRQMKDAHKEKDERIVETIQKTEDSVLQKIVDGSFPVDFDERVECYLKGMMSQSEERSFFDELKKHPDLELRAKVMALAVEQMKSTTKAKDEAIIEKIKNTDMKTLEKMVRGKNGGAVIVSLFSRRVLAMAASVLFIIGLFFSYNQYDISQTKNVYNKYASYTDGFNQTMKTRSKISESDSITSYKLSTLFALVQRGDSIDYVIEELKTYPKTEGFQVEIEWNLAMAYLRNGNKKDAKLILQGIAKNYTGQNIAKKAQEVLDEINNIGLFK
jgi:hypothetical protein